MSDATISWLNNQKSKLEQKDNTEFIKDILLDYIKCSTSPLVTVVNILKIRHPTNSPIQAYFSTVLDQVRMCDCENITNPEDWICLMQHV